MADPDRAPTPKASADEVRAAALIFQSEMMSNDWLCESTVGHEVGTCLGCITVALEPALAALLAALDEEREAHERTRAGAQTTGRYWQGRAATAEAALEVAQREANDAGDLAANLDYAVDHHWTRGQLVYACDELRKHGLTPCAANFDWLAAAALATSTEPDPREGDDG